MIKPELDTDIITDHDPEKLMKKIKDFKKDNIVDYSQYAPILDAEDKILFTIALFFRPRPVEGMIEGIQLPDEEKPGSNNSPIWMDCPKCKKPCLPYKYDVCRCGHEFTKEDKKLFKELLAADGSQKEVKKDGKARVAPV